MIILRKFWIAFTSLMFRKNPSFQMASALLVLFVSFALQSKFEPYMSASQYLDVLENHQRKADKGSKLHKRLEVALIRAREGRRERNKTVKLGDRTRVRRAGSQTAQYLFNYNTLESYLLACGVLVCLSGVMFESGRFESDYYSGQQSTLTYLLIALVSSSIIYWTTVLMVEVILTLQPDAFSGKKKSSKNKRKEQRKAEASRAVFDSVDVGGHVGGEIALTVMSNPMHSGEAELKASNLPTEVPNPQQWRQIVEKFKTMETNLLELQNKRVELVGSVFATAPDSAPTTSDAAGRGRGGKKKYRRRVSLGLPPRGRGARKNRRVRREFTSRTTGDDAEDAKL